jgi:hypothetical protein
MINELQLTETSNHMCMFLGIDSLQLCADKRHFASYPKFVVYQFNNMGYRDEEWPEDLTNKIWCVGDSFTVGLGQPYEEIWPQIIQSKINKRTINVSVNGASNDWIARRVKYIAENFQPEAILVQWSYLHRRELADTTLTDEQRAIWHDTKDTKDLENFIKNFDAVCKLNANIVHSFVPLFCDFTAIEQLHTEIYRHLDESHVKYFTALEHLDIITMC